MFFQNPEQKLPDELILNIIDRLPVEDAIRFLLVSKEMNAFIKDDSLWQKFGARNFADFVTRMKALPENSRRFILKGQYNYTLTLAEEIARIQQIPKDSRIYPPPENDERLKALQEAGLITDQQATNMNPYSRSSLLEDNGIAALLEGLLTAQQATDMGSVNLETLLYNNGLVALREGLITVQQVADMHYNREADIGEIQPLNSLGALFLDGGSGYGIAALREGLITVQQVTAMHSNYVSALCSDNGLVALREGLLTVQQATDMPYDNLATLMGWNNGIAALRELKSSKGTEINNLTGQQLFDFVLKIIESKSGPSPSPPKLF